MKVKQNDQEYNRYVEAITPKHSCFKNCLHAFLVGGCICLLGQVIFNVCTTQFHYEEADAMSVCSILLVFLSVLLTGLNLYKPLAKYGGAGALVPITGFANGVCASAVEFQKEGQVFDLVCRLLLDTKKRVKCSEKVSKCSRLPDLLSYSVS